MMEARCSERVKHSNDGMNRGTQGRAVISVPASASSSLFNALQRNKGEIGFCYLCGSFFQRSGRFQAECLHGLGNEYPALTATSPCHASAPGCRGWTAECREQIPGQLAALSGIGSPIQINLGEPAGRAANCELPVRNPLPLQRFLP